MTPPVGSGGNSGQPPYELKANQFNQGAGGAPSSYPTEFPDSEGAEDFYVFTSTNPSESDGPPIGLAGFFMGCASLGKIEGESQTPLQPNATYPEQVSYELSWEFLRNSPENVSEEYAEKVQDTIPPPKRGAFIGRLKPFLENLSTDYILNTFPLEVERNSNGLYDMVLRDPEGRYYHLVAPKNENSDDFFNEYITYKAMPGTSDQKVYLTIKGVQYELLTSDSANTDVERAKKRNQILTRRNNCVKPLKRIATPNNPNPKSFTEASIRTFCIAQIKDAYGVNLDQARGILEMLYVPLIEQGKLTWGQLPSIFQNLPEELPVEVDRCLPDSSSVWVKGR